MTAWRASTLLQGYLATSNIRKREPSPCTASMVRPASRSCPIESTGTASEMSVVPCWAAVTRATLLLRTSKRSVSSLAGYAPL